MIHTTDVCISNPFSSTIYGVFIIPALHIKISIFLQLFLIFSTKVLIESIFERSTFSKYISSFPDSFRKLNWMSLLSIISPFNQNIIFNNIYSIRKHYKTYY